MLVEPLASTPFKKHIFIQLVVGGSSLSDAGCVGPSVEAQRQAGSKFAWLGKPMQWSGFSQISADCWCISIPKANLEIKMETVHFLVEDDVQKDQSKGLMYRITCAFFFRLTLLLYLRWDILRYIGRMGLSACLQAPLLKVTLVY